MAMHNPEGPGQLRAQLLGRRRRPARVARARASGPSPSRWKRPKVRVRSETFADHYSQARQFYISQTEIEQNAHRATR